MHDRKRLIRTARPLRLLTAALVAASAVALGAAKPGGLRPVVSTTHGYRVAVPADWREEAPHDPDELIRYRADPAGAEARVAMWWSDLSSPEAMIDWMGTAVDRGDDMERRWLPPAKAGGLRAYEWWFHREKDGGGTETVARKLLFFPWRKDHGAGLQLTVIVPPGADEAAARAVVDSFRATGPKEPPGFPVGPAIVASADGFSFRVPWGWDCRPSGGGILVVCSRESTGQHLFVTHLIRFSGLPADDRAGIVADMEMFASTTGDDFVRVSDKWIDAKGPGGVPVYEMWYRARAYGSLQPFVTRALLLPDGRVVKLHVNVPGAAAKAEVRRILDGFTAAAR